MGRLSFAGFLASVPPDVNWASEIPSPLSGAVPNFEQHLERASQRQNPASDAREDRPRESGSADNQSSLNNALQPPTSSQPQPEANGESTQSDQSEQIRPDGEQESPATAAEESDNETEETAEDQAGPETVLPTAAPPIAQAQKLAATPALLLTEESTASLGPQDDNSDQGTDKTALTKQIPPIQPPVLGDVAKTTAALPPEGARGSQAASNAAQDAAPVVDLAADLAVDEKSAKQPSTGTPAAPGLSTRGVAATENVTQELAVSDQVFQTAASSTVPTPAAEPKKVQGPHRPRQEQATDEVVPTDQTETPGFFPNLVSDGASTLPEDNSAAPSDSKTSADVAAPPEPTGISEALPNSARTEGVNLAAPKGLAIQLGPRAGARTDEVAPGASEIDRQRFVQRVVRALHNLGDAEGGQIRLRLSPPELGSIRLDVTLRGGVLAAQVEAETPQARTALLENLPALRERLAEQNIKIERFDVDLMNQSSGGLSNPFSSQDQPAQQDQSTQPRLRSATPAEAEPLVPAASVRATGAGKQLNVVV